MDTDIWCPDDYIRPIGISGDSPLIRFAGTGFGFAKPGLVLTAAHVLPAGTQPNCICLQLRNGSFVQARTVTVHPAADVVALRFEPNQSLKTFPLSAPPVGMTSHHLGTEIRAYGYPYREDGPNRKLLEPRLLTGWIQRSFRHENRSYNYHAYETSFVAVPGQSGSPVLQTEGVPSVLGVVTENFESAVLIDKYEEYTEGHQTEVHKIHQIVRYGIAVDLAEIADWIEQL